MNDESGLQLSPKKTWCKKWIQFLFRNWFRNNLFIQTPFNMADGQIKFPYSQIMLHRNVCPISHYEHFPHLSPNLSLLDREDTPCVHPAYSCVGLIHLYVLFWILDHELIAVMCLSCYEPQWKYKHFRAPSICVSIVAVYLCTMFLSFSNCYQTRSDQILKTDNPPPSQFWI